MGLALCMPLLWCAALPAVAALPDGRAYELVSPAEKGGNSAGASNAKVAYSVSSADGERVLFGISGPVGETQSGLGPAYAVARRGTAGWQTRGVLPRPVGRIEVIEDAPMELFYPSSELTRFAFATRGPYVTEGDKPHSPNLFMSGEDATVPPQWLAKPTIPNPVPGLGENTSFLLPTPAGPPAGDGRIYFTYFGTLVPEDASRAPNIGSEQNTWGLYEWVEGQLRSAARLPDGAYDPFGAVPAASGERGERDTPAALDNQVSADGSRAFFVSPDPQSNHPIGDPVELYVREKGERSVLVSRNALQGGLPAAGYLEEGKSTGVTGMRNASRCPGGCSSVSFAYASSDGARVFFTSMDKLARSSEGDEPSGTGPWTYGFDVQSEALTYLPGLSGTIVAASADGTAVMYVTYAAANSGSLHMWANGHSQLIGELPEPAFTPVDFGELFVAPARVSGDGSTFVFETDAAITNARDRTGSEPANNVGGYGQVYRYAAKPSELICVSCPSAGDKATGDANLSNNDLGRDEEHEPGTGLVLDNRGMAADGGRIFFDTPNALVPSDVNGVRDVYEWEERAVHLISSGSDPHPAFLLDNSESGLDVFFATSGALVPADGDGNYDVYDARAAHVPGEPLGFGAAPVTARCSSECQGPAAGEPPPPGLLSAMSSNSGNEIGSTFTSPKRTPLTRSQKLTLALKVCNRKPRKQRGLCVMQAHRRYGRPAQAEKSKRKANR